MSLLLGWVILPSVILAGVFLWLAARGLRKNKRLWIYVSIVYGVICSAYAMSSVAMGSL